MSDPQNEKLPVIQNATPIDINNNGSVEEESGIGDMRLEPSPNTFVVQDNNEVEGYNSKSGNNPTILAGSNYPFKAPQPQEDMAPTLTSRASASDRRIWGINTHEEKPTETIENVRRFHGANDLAEASKGYGYGSNPDVIQSGKKTEVDEYGSRQSAVSATYNMAERVKLNNNIRNFTEGLKNGRELTEIEVEKLTERHLSKSEEYKSFKSSYEAKNLSPEDMQIILQHRFKDTIDQFHKSLMDSSGVIVSNKLSLDDLSYLTEEYKDSVTKAYFQDRMARMDSSDAEFASRERAKKIEEFEKKYPGYGKLAFEAEERARVLDEENRLLREKLEQLENRRPIAPQVPPQPVTPTPEVTPTQPTVKTESTFKEKVVNFKEKLSQFWSKNKAAIIGGCLGFATAVAGAPIFATVGLGLIVTGASRIGKAITESKYMELENKAKKETLTPEETARMERNKKWAGRLSTACNASTGFLTGFGLGSALNYVVNVASTTGIPVDSVHTAASNNMGNGVLDSATPVDNGSTIIGTGTETVGGSWFDGNISASNLGWDYQSMGWNGDSLVFGENGGMSGMNNQQFFEQLSKLVPKEAIQGQTAGNQINQALRQIFNGADPVNMASQTAQALGY